MSAFAYMPTPVRMSATCWLTKQILIATEGAPSGTPPTQHGPVPRVERPPARVGVLVRHRHTYGPSGFEPGAGWRTGGVRDWGVTLPTPPPGSRRCRLVR